MSRSTAADKAPPELPGYQFLQHLGAGGNSQVYLYEQALPKRKVAVKVLDESGLTETARRRFTAEANVTAGLSHRHIVQVFEANVTPDGRPYLVMPYYPQPNLSVRARRAHFSVAEVLRIGIQIGSAVETSHRNDVLHRDIKPQNILTDGYGEPALTDFGIATTKGGDGPEGLSVPWSPPEILYGTASGDERADVYSLGATLWHLLVGRSPFEQQGGDNTAFALMGRIKSDSPPRTGRADVPESLERLLRQAMAKDPAARPQTALDFIRGLQAVEQELRLPLTQPILPADEPPPQGGPGPVSSPGRPGGAARDPGSDTWSPFGGAGGTTSVRGAHAAAAPNGAAGWASGPHPAGEDADTRARGPRRIDPWSASGDAAAAGTGGRHQVDAWPAGAAEEMDTRTRGPRRIDAWSPGAGEDAETRARGPRRIDAWPDAEPSGGRGRHRQFPAEAPEAATMARSAVGRPAGPWADAEWPGAGGPGDPGLLAGDPGSGTVGAGGTRRPSRAVLLAGGTVLAAAAIGVGFVALRHSGGQGTPPAGQSQAGQSQSALSGGQNALGPGVSAPGKPSITATRASSSDVRFSWTYANHVSGDVFRWQRVGTPTAVTGRTTQPQLTVAAAPGQTVCIEVEVVRADGSQASGFSSPVCWPLSSS
jgi:serine/threonine protein kinase